MNVLVYAGQEVVQSSLSRITGALKPLLFPHYTVQSVTSHTISTQPWTTSCALLVLPQCKHFVFGSSAALQSIKLYVEGGGKILALVCGMNRSPVPPSTGSLYFQDTRFRSPTYVLLGPGKATEPKSIEIASPAYEGLLPLSISSNAAIDRQPDDQILAVCSQERESQVVGAISAVGQGKVAVWLPNIEEIGDAGVRNSLLRTTLAPLDIRIPDRSEHDKISHRPTPQFLVSNPVKHDLIHRVTDAIGLRDLASAEELRVEDENDQFCYRPCSSPAFEAAKIASTFVDDEPSRWQPKQVLICSKSTLPSRDMTPLFDLEAYFRALGPPVQSGDNEWRLGDVLYYGEVVTSTQTMLDKNPKLLSSLPTSIVSLASHQLTGRGRGSNTWLSPAGCLQFSVLLRLSLSAFPASKLVFVQYLFGLAVVEACRNKAVLGAVGERIRLKWPNDIYAVDEDYDDPHTRKKIGGILVNTSFSGGQVDIVIGCGINVLNEPPIMSLAQLISSGEEPSPTMEATLAAILTKFDQMWTTFVAENGSFDSFMDLYLERWLHSDQQVTLTSVVPQREVRIVGLTADHGLLRTMPEGQNYSAGKLDYIDLQPDGNSFDLMAGLIRTKAT